MLLPILMKNIQESILAFEYLFNGGLHYTIDDLMNEVTSDCHDWQVLPLLCM